MPVELLAHSNPCGEFILHLVARGNAIIAELLRLSENIPPCFLSIHGSQKSGKITLKLMPSKYSELISDFAYFQGTDAFESKIQTNAQLQDLDDEFHENFIDLLNRFYVVFGSVHKYAMDLNRFIEELEEGYYIQQNLETVMLNQDGRQLMSEALYLYGVMLLVIDRKFDGLVRERLLVAFYRHGEHSLFSESSVDAVCQMLRSTGFVAGVTRPPNYPENYFSRVHINPSFVNMVIARLRSDDLYNQIPIYPLPEHRSTALASQAALLYVCLFFAPEILHQQTSVMREIVDKFFPDNWVISIYMGISVNLVEAWDPYKAAKVALANSLELSNVKSISQRHGLDLPRLNTELQQYSMEGTLTEEYVLDNTAKLLNAIRRCNVTLRWMILHAVDLSPTTSESNKRCKQLHEQVVADSKLNLISLFELLLNTSEFELKLKDMLKSMLVNRDAKWKESKADVVKRLVELSDVFSGTIPLTRIEKNEKLQKWFHEISEQTEKLDFLQPVDAGKKTIQLIRALEEVQEFHNLESHLQVRQFLADTRQCLHQMLRTVNMQDESLVQMQMVGDFSYAWELIENFTKQMQEGIKKNPSLSIQLRAVFLKLGTALQLPLLRIEQAKSNDLLSVSQYYSEELVLYVRKVLQVIPATVFQCLIRIIRLQTMQVPEVPTRLDKDKLKDYAQLDGRYEIAKLTQSISVLTEGVLSMKTTLVGIVKVDPKQLLEDGIRKELVRHLASAMHSTLIFNPKAKENELVPKLQSLAKQVDGFRRSFEYISDYFNMCGLKIWQEEFSRIVNYYVERECNVFMTHQIQEWDSVYQSKAIPIPNFDSTDNVWQTFIGRLVGEVLKVTDPKATVYVHDLGFWYDQKTRKEAVNPQLWKILLDAVSNIGVRGIDRMFCFMIKRELISMMKHYKRDVVGKSEWLQLLGGAKIALNDGEGLVAEPARTYLAISNQFGKSSFSGCLDAWTGSVLKIGQLQILRLHLLRELHNACKFQSTLLENALQALNKSLLLDIADHYKDAAKPYPKDENPLLFDLTNYLESAGITDPLIKVYSCLPTQEYGSLFVFLSIYSQIPKLTYVKNVGLISRRPQDATDGSPFVIGLVTLLNQFHASQRETFLRFLGQYVNSMVHSLVGPQNKLLELPNELVVVLRFLEEFVRFSTNNNTSTLLKRFVPEYILEMYVCMSS